MEKNNKILYNIGSELISNVVKEDKMKQHNKITALLCRLSRDDGNVGDSGSIQTQKIILEEYAKSHGFKIYEIYVDDGYSGLNFNRPGFQRMLQDIESGKVNVVITKDLSRLGRDYIMTGYYTENYFKDNAVRYIAINDNNDIAPFKNILNDMYAKDTSRKVKTAVRQRLLKGMFIASHPPYGYKRNPYNKNHLIIDEEVVDVVRLIFDLALSNIGIATIAKELNRRGIPIPSVYKASKGYQCYQTLLDSRRAKFNDKDVETWSTATVGNILRNQMYVGDMVGNKREVKNYRTGKQIVHTKDEYIIIPNTHEPIISREDFEKVQMLVANKHRPSKTNHENEFRGLLKCANCGRTMTMYHKVLASGQVIWRYRCMGKTIRHGIDPETNIIKYDDIYNIVFKRLKELFNSIKNDDDSFIYKLMSKHEVGGQEKKLEVEKNKIQRKLDTISKLIKKLYEDYIEGILNIENYQTMVNEYQKEQVELKARLEKIADLINQKTNENDNIKKFKEVANKYLDFKVLTAELVNNLIDHIEIGFPKVVDGIQVREINIFYRFIN